LNNSILKDAKKKKEIELKKAMKEIVVNSG